MDHNVTIGAKVKAFRTAKKYTLKQLSEESGLSIGFLSQLERALFDRNRLSGKACYDPRSQSVFVL